MERRLLFATLSVHVSLHIPRFVPRTRHASAIAAAVLATGACARASLDTVEDAPGTNDAAPAIDATPQPMLDAVLAACPPNSGAGPLGGARPTALEVPAAYDPARRYPLILELHGRGATGPDAEAAWKIGANADANGLFVIAPTGTLDSPPAPETPATFWNATDGCCDKYSSGVDDVAYLRSLICHTMANYSIDPNKVFIIGGSNGGFMAHRMACDASDLVTAIISISGATWNDPARCQPTHPVSVLQIHGTADPIVPYEGTAALFPGPAPGAPTTYETWATLNHCTGPNTQGAPASFDRDLPGNETTPVWKELGGACTVATQLFVVGGGGHTFSLAANTQQFFIDWFLATPPNH